METQSILNMDAVEMKQAFDAGNLTPEEAVNTCISHQQTVNPELNLVVEDRYEQALAEAAEYTRQYEKGTVVGKLAGIPMSMKESFEVSGMHTTGGMVSHKDSVAGADAEAVRRLKAEGAIILCKTNTPTLCFCQETDNNLFGRSNNPWNPGYTPGGSSGGEAALMAVGGVAAGFGSDIGGSIRMPAHFNGVVGFKPGAFRFPDKGHFPFLDLERQRHMIGFGPIVKSVRDAAFIYSVVFPGFEPPGDLSLPENLKVITFDTFHKTRCTPETVQIRKEAENKLAAAGAAIDTRVPELMKAVARIWQLAMSEDKGRALTEIAYPGNPKGFLMDWLRSKTGGTPRHHEFLSWALIGIHLFPPGKKQLKWIDAGLEKGYLELKSLLGETGVILIPVYPSPAKRHGAIYREIFNPLKTFQWVMPYTALGNVYGLPAITIPCGRSEQGLPIGLQVLCLPGKENLLFQTARFLERAFGGYTRCDFYDTKR